MPRVDRPLNFPARAAVAFGAVAILMAVLPSAAALAMPSPAPTGLLARAADTRPVLLDFHSEHCGPCQRERSQVARLVAKGYPVKTVDIDATPGLAHKYRVTAVPCFIVLDDRGRAIARTEGYQSAEDLAAFYLKARSASRRKATAEGAVAEADEAPAPKPWETAVRIRIQGPTGSYLGSGTVIHSTPSESIVLTCAHIFRIEGSPAVAPSAFRLPIAVDLFDGVLGGPSRQQLKPVGTAAGEAIDYDFGQDVGLIRIRPGKVLPASPVAAADWSPEPGQRLVCLGCSHGEDATAWSTAIDAASPSATMQGGATKTRCVGAPKQGRSGGGLYTVEGEVIGVCNFAEDTTNRGLYATPASINGIIDRNPAAFGPAPLPAPPVPPKGMPAPESPAARRRPMPVESPAVPARPPAASDPGLPDLRDPMPAAPSSPATSPLVVALLAILGTVGVFGAGAWAWLQGHLRLPTAPASYAPAAVATAPAEPRRRLIDPADLTLDDLAELYDRRIRDEKAAEAIAKQRADLVAKLRGALAPPSKGAKPGPGVSASVDHVEP